jgi:hypothetical protein
MQASIARQRQWLFAKGRHRRKEKPAHAPGKYIFCFQPSQRGMSPTQSTVVTSTVNFSTNHILQEKQLGWYEVVAQNGNL